MKVTAISSHIEWGRVKPPKPATRAAPKKRCGSGTLRQVNNSKPQGIPWKRWEFISQTQIICSDSPRVVRSETLSTLREQVRPKLNINASHQILVRYIFRVLCTRYLSIVTLFAPWMKGGGGPGDDWLASKKSRNVLFLLERASFPGGHSVRGCWAKLNRVQVQTDVYHGRK